MRILIAGPSRSLPMWRPITWAVRHGDAVWVVEEEGGEMIASGAASVPSGAQQLAVPAVNASTAPFDGAGTENAARLQALAAHFRPDLIHAHHLSRASSWCTDAGLHPLLVSVWGALNFLLEDAPPPLLPAWIQRILSAADAIIVESPALVAACRPHVPPTTRVALIPLGADMQRFHPNQTTPRRTWRNALHIPDDAIALLSPRGWGRIYRHAQIVEAVALARPRLQRPIVLVFTKLGRNEVAGDADACIEEVRQRAAELDLSDALRWTPSVAYELMPSLYAMADVVINFPARDAFPSTLVEAAACARPIVTARLPGYRGTFIEEFCTLVEPQQPAALADAIVAVVNEPAGARRARLLQARQIVAEQYDERIAQARLQQLYQEMAVVR